MGHGEAGTTNRSKNLEVEIIDPVLVGDLIDPSGGALARVVHEAVEATPPIDGRIDEPFEVRQMGDIGLHNKCVAPGAPQTLLSGGQPIGVPPADRYPGAFLCQPIRQGGSQPVCPACDEDDLAVEVQIHNAILAQPREQPDRLSI